MLLQPIAIRLRETVLDFRSVKGASDFAAAQEDLKSTPCAWVVPLNDSADPNELQGMQVEQRVRERFGVILAVSNVRDTRGDAVNKDLELVRTPAIAALMGWQHDAAYDPIQYGGGRLLMMTGATLYWQLEFTTAYWERNY